MCGFLGIVSFDGAPIDAPLVVRMRDTMYHRGPDDGGILVRDQVALAHRRLSILDLSPAGHQPMCNEDGTVWITFNGEIYNYVELRAWLVHRGHCFRSTSDTEVIIHLYEELGERCVDVLNGMFGFAIWDENKQRLFGARDRIGIKPFYYYADDRRFICASEIKAVLADTSISRRPDNAGIADYLFAGAPLAGKTFFAGIHELMPGCTLSVENGRISTRTYWDLHYRYTTRTSSLAAHELAELLDDAVRTHCRSDAALGAHLSGGLDSSTVAGFAARHIQPLHTFSIKFNGGEYYDETPFAKQVSQSIWSIYHEDCGSAADLASTYSKLLWHMDQPPAGNGDFGYSYYTAARLASKHVKVALTGHGGDEIFAGYNAHIAMLTRGARPRWFDRALNLARGVNLGADESKWMRLHCALRPARNPFVSRSFVRSLNGYSPVADYLTPFRDAPTDRLLDRCLFHDLRVYLPQLLHKEDRASMAVSIESRVPLLDHRVVELMASIPPEQKIPGLLPKALLRQAAASVVPNAIVDRKDKAPFPVPLDRWLQSSLVAECDAIVNSQMCLDRGVFDADLIRGGTLTQAQRATVMNVELWFRLFIDSSGQSADLDGQPRRNVDRSVVNVIAGA